MKNLTPRSHIQGFQIVGLVGPELEACAQFMFKGYQISLSTIGYGQGSFLNKIHVYGTLDGSCMDIDTVDCRLLSQHHSVEEAIDWVIANPLNPKAPEVAYVAPVGVDMPANPFKEEFDNRFPGDTKVIGLSLSICIQHILRGLVPLERLHSITSLTAVPNDAAFEGLLDYYSDGYWYDDPVRAREIATTLWKEGRITQPRLLDDSYRHNFPELDWCTRTDKYIKAPDDES
jgi:hypothetical protein